MIPTKLLTDTAKLPTRGSEHSAGLDLYFDFGSHFKNTAQFTAPNDPFEGDGETVLHLMPGQRTVLRTGIAMVIPEGHYGQIAPRSGLAVKQGLEILAGVIDADYRDEIMVVVLNSGENPIAFQHHDRVAQLLVLPCVIDEAVQFQTLPETMRGDGRFGSTGK